MKVGFRTRSFSRILLVVVTTHLLVNWLNFSEAFVPIPAPCTLQNKRCPIPYDKGLHGWFDNLWQNEESSSATRQQEYPEQYPATYDFNNITLKEDEDDTNKILIRRLLKNTQLESRPISLVFQASQDGWTASSFHSSVDTRGACVVLATTKDNRVVGGYNPKGWASLGGARPSIAAFLFYSYKDSWQKLQKVGGGGLACASDDPSFGISFGPDGLVIPFLDENNRVAKSKLGTYYERGPQELPSLFPSGNAELKDVLCYTGIYGPNEEIPYSGGVLDMTSG